MPKLTEDERLRRQAARKADAKNAKLVARAGPLFADQIPAEEFTTPAAEYRAIRLSWAQCPRGVEAAALARVDWNWDLYVVRRLAKAHMRPEDFAVADRRMRDFGDTMRFWRNLLVHGHRIVLDYERISHGMKQVVLPPNQERRHELVLQIEKVELRERLVWPPEGWTPPLTEQQLDELLGVPPYVEYGGAVDPLGLADGPAATMEERDAREPDR